MGAHILNLHKKIIVLFLSIFSCATAIAGFHKISFVSADSFPQINSLALPDILIRAPRKKYTVQGDTISYTVSNYLKADTKKVEDLFKQMEGFRVDDRGKIFFNGKEVDRILVDGDDLAGSEYGIVSKNIQAGLVDRVQVYEHYSENRLLKGVEHSGKVALDLRFRVDKKDKLNGNAELGYGLTGKHNIDLNMIGIFKKFKSAAFFDKNDIGRIANSNNIRFDQGMNQSESFSKIKIQKDPFEFSSFPVLPLSQNYSNINRDNNISLIGTVKLSKFQTIRYMSSLYTFRQQNNIYQIFSFFAPGYPNWNRNETTRSFSKQNINDMGIYYKADKLKNRVSDYSISWLHTQDDVNYFNQRKGFIDDSLQENKQSIQKNISFNGKETIRMGKGLVVITTMNIDHSLLDARFDNSYLPPIVIQEFSFKGSRQVYYSGRTSKGLSTLIYFKNRQLTTSAGAHYYSEFNKMESLQDRLQSDFILNRNPLNLFYREYKTLGKFDYSISKKTFVQVDLGAGKGVVNILPDKKFADMLFHTRIEVGHQKTPFNKWGAAISIEKQKPMTSMIIPVPIYGHNATVLFGLENPAFPLTKNIELNYQRSDFYRGLQYSFSLLGSIINNDNAIAYFNYSDHSVRFYFRADKTVQFNTNLHVEKYFSLPRIKSSLESTHFLMCSPEKINGIDTRQYLGSHSFKFNMISNWTRMFNVEVSSSMILASVSAMRKWFDPNNSIFQRSHFIKFKLHPHKKVYTNFQITAINYKGVKPFFGGNVNLQWQVFKSLQASVLFHNIFNNTRFIEMQNQLYSSRSTAYTLQKRYFLFSLQFDL